MKKVKELIVEGLKIGLLLLCLTIDLDFPLVSQLKQVVCC